MSNSFIAIDFETANPKRNTPCAVGVVKVIDNKIVDALYSFIDPETTIWSIWCYKTHNITYQHVKGQPKFNEIWEKILLMIEGVDFIIGHSVSFEKSVINQCCEKYNLPYLDIKYKCSLKLIKKVYKLTNGKLDNVCKVFGFELKHHNALSDALGSARLAINYYKDKERHKRFGKYILSEEEKKIIDDQMFEITYIPFDYEGEIR